PEQGRHFSFFVGQGLNLFMEFGPDGEVSRAVLSCCRIKLSLNNTGVDAPVSLRQVKKLAADRLACQIEKVSQGLRPDLAERPVQTKHRVLQHVVGLLMTTDN